LISYGSVNFSTRSSEIVKKEPDSSISIIGKWARVVLWRKEKKQLVILFYTTQSHLLH